MSSSIGSQSRFHAGKAIVVASELRLLDPFSALGGGGGDADAVAAEAVEAFLIGFTNLETSL